ncbi:MAG: hypothetical protein A3C35_02820 [Omnitrophica bacterium RIFCSPHIGHO2_02_FULL_46_11]|nr:MAG: hypothetical protein A3C35_02820 [Omnitrophica bacterium RIFCSPHIGHO2_02_FULL_46_11]
MRKILVLDDDPLVLKSVEQILKREGYEAEYVQNAQEAIDKAKKESFDLVISDIRMPGKNGVEAVREMRLLFNEKVKKDIPIIFITGFAEMGDQLNAEHLGEVILKPFDLEQLIITIREYL